MHKMSQQYFRPVQQNLAQASHSHFAGNSAPGALAYLTVILSYCRLNKASVGMEGSREEKELIVFWLKQRLSDAPFSE